MKNKNNNFFEYVRSNANALALIRLLAVDEDKYLENETILKMRCPFTETNDMTFVFNKKKEIFYCPDCEAGGDIISFIQMLYKTSALESALNICLVQSIEIPGRFINVDPEPHQDLDDHQGYDEKCIACTEPITMKHGGFFREWNLFDGKETRGMHWYCARELVANHRNKD